MIICKGTYFEYSPPGGASSAGYANSVAFYTDGADEQYGYCEFLELTLTLLHSHLVDTDTNCQEETEASDGPTGCVGVVSGVRSFMKTA